MDLLFRLPSRLTQRSTRVLPIHRAVAVTLLLLLLRVVHIRTFGSGSSALFPPLILPCGKEPFSLVVLSPFGGW